MSNAVPVTSVNCDTPTEDRRSTIRVNVRGKKDPFVYANAFFFDETKDWIKVMYTHPIHGDQKIAVFFIPNIISLDYTPTMWKKSVFKEDR